MSEWSRVLLLAALLAAVRASVVFTGDVARDFAADQFAVELIDGDFQDVVRLSFSLSFSLAIWCSRSYRFLTRALVASRVRFAGLASRLAV